MYRVGEFARIGGVSTKTLRFYDEIGLLRPVRIDPVTRYRYYSPEQLVDLARIIAGRDMGLSLTEIRGGGRRAALESARRRLRRSLVLAQHSLERIEAALADRTDASRIDTPVTIKPRPATHVASLGEVVFGYDDVVEAERELLGRVPERFRGATRGVLWHQCADMGSAGGEPFVEIRVTSSMDRAVELKELPAVTVACAYAPDDYEAAERAYEAIRGWMRVRPDGFQLAGPKRELCHGRTLEIQFPLASH